MTGARFSAPGLRIASEASPARRMQDREAQSGYVSCTSSVRRLRKRLAVLLSTVWLFDWAQLGSVAATIKMKSVGRNAGFENEMYRYFIDRLANVKVKDDLAN
jgi:hypothetical protein